MKLLNCVTSYQRYPYLRNTVESLLEYFRFGDTLVVDNGSTDPALHQYLDELENRGLFVMRRSWEGETDRPGLNDGMNDAMDFAAERGYDFVQFVQDDMQFMWHDPSVLETVQHVFSSRSDAIQVCPLFSNRINCFAAEELEAIDRLLEQLREARENAQIGVVDLEALSEFAEPGDVDLERGRGNECPSGCAGGGRWRRSCGPGLQENRCMGSPS